MNDEAGVWEKWGIFGKVFEVFCFFLLLHGNGSGRMDKSN